MRKEIACVILILLAACVNKPGQPVQEATSTAVIGGADSMTSIVVAYLCFISRYSNIRITSVSTLVYKRFT